MDSRPGTLALLLEMRSFRLTGSPIAAKPSLVDAGPDDGDDEMKVTMNCIDSAFIDVAVCPTRHSVSGSPKMCDVSFNQRAVVVSPQPAGENSAG